jgi:two-component system response regulator YesN
MRRPETTHFLSQIYAGAIEIVARDYAAPLEIDGVAARLSTSRRQLQRAFSEIGGTTFSQHLTSVRMVHAAELLGDPRMTIGTVAWRVGYRHPAHFTKSFRLHHGTLPSAYRRRVALPRLAAQLQAAHHAR